MMYKSEVARLREQIEAELTAMRRAMHGFALGTARHDFIHARMDNIGTYQEKLAQQVGETAATQLVCSLYVQTTEQEND